MFRAVSMVLLPIAFGVVAEGASLPEGMALTTMKFTAYPGYSGNLQVSGRVSIGSAQDGTVELFYDLQGTDPTCTTGKRSATDNGCGIHIHEGNTCDMAGGHHYDNVALTADPWLNSVYATDVAGKATGHNVFVTSGRTLGESDARVIVVHDVTGARVACAPLVAPSKSGFASVPVLKKYPDYPGPLDVQGQVDIGQLHHLVPDFAQVLRFILSGVDPACTATAKIAGVANACGIHVHEGTTCDEAAKVGGHWWNQQKFDEDPWKFIRYVTVGDSWFSLARSKRPASTQGVSTPIITGFKAVDAVGRAFVVHDITGARVACGLIGEYQESVPVIPNAENLAWSSSAVALASVCGVAAISILGAVFYRFRAKRRAAYQTQRDETVEMRAVAVARQ